MNIIDKLDKFLTEGITLPRDSKKLKKGAKVKILRGKFKGETGTINMWHDATDDEEEQVDVKVKGKMKFLGFDDLELIN